MRRKSIIVSAMAILVVLGLCGSTLIADVNEGLISHWRFDEGSGTIAYDSKGMNDGTVNGATWATGQLGGALNFDGHNDYVDMIYPGPLGNSPRTITSWAKTSSNSKQIMFSYGGASVQRGSTIRAGISAFGCQGVTFDISYGVVTYSATVADGKWHHYAYIVPDKVNAAIGDVVLYQDGVLLDNVCASAHSSVINTLPTYAIEIGRYTSDQTQYFNGTIDDVRLYDRALSAEEIMELYVPADSGPIAHWKFDEGSGAIAYDSAGTNDGTIYGAAWTTGQLGSALDFDGMNDYVDIPYDSSLDINASQGISISVWINLNSYPAGWNQGPIFGLFDSTGAATKNYLLIDKPPHGNLITWDQYPPYYGCLRSIKPDLDTWYHVAVVEDSTYRAIYINGSLDISDNTSESYQGNPPDTIRIGSRADIDPFYFDGSIDDVMIFDRSLSAEEVQQLYESWLPILVDVDIKPGSCPNPLNVTSRGILTVAVLGSSDLDINTIVATSIRLSGVAPIRDSYEDVATKVSDANECECSTQGPDGFPDLTLKFETQMIVAAIGEVDHGDELVLELAGVLSDETPIVGSDCIVIRGRHKPLNRADFNADGTVDMADFAAFAENWLQSSIVEY